MKQYIDNLIANPTPLLRDLNPNLILDLIICIKDNVSLNSWLEDVSDEPEAYPYTYDDLRYFLSLLDPKP